MNRLKGFLALLACAIIFASFSVLVRVLSTEMGLYQQIGLRNVLALMVAIGVVVTTKQTFISLKNVPVHLNLLYMASFPVSVVFYNLAVLDTKIVTAIFGLYVGSLISSLFFGIVVFKEKVTNLKLLSLALVSLGLISYTYPFNLSLLSRGFYLALVSGFFDACANGFRKYLGGKVDRFVLVALQMIGGVVVAVTLGTLFNQLSLPTLSLAAWAISALFGLLLVAISYLTLIGFQNFDLNLGTVVLSSELFFGSLFAFLFYQEQSSFTEILGGTLIIVATVVANWTIQKESRLVLAYQKTLAFANKTAAILHRK